MALMPFTGRLHHAGSEINGKRAPVVYGTGSRTKSILFDKSGFAQRDPNVNAELSSNQRRVASYQRPNEDYFSY